MERFEYDTNPASAGSRRIGSCFPLLWLLVPQILAYVYCGNVPWASDGVSARLVAGALLLGVAAAACVAEYFSEEKSSLARAASGIWRMSFPLSAFFFFCVWWQAVVPPVADGASFSPRETSAEIRIERTFRTTEKNYNGIGIVEKISDEQISQSMTGARVWYSVSRTLLPDAEDSFAEGARLRVSGVVRGVYADGLSSEGFVDFLKRERVGAFFSVKESAEFVPGSDGAFARFCGKAKATLRARLAEISASENPNSFFPVSGKILGAMLLGERSLLTVEQNENFLLTGTIHIFSVSGLHITMLATGVFFLLNFLRLPRFVSWTTALVVLWFYVQIVGAPPSAMRAWLMIFFIFLGNAFGRGGNSFHGLLFSAFFALLLEPLVLNNAGFRLSYLVVAAILLYGVPAAERLNRVCNFNRWIPAAALSRRRKFFAWITRGAIDGFCISVAAFLAGTPCVISLFGFCSFLSLPSNVLLVPLVVLASWFGAAAAVVALIPVVGVFLGKIIFIFCAIPLAAVNFGTSVLARIPGIAELSFPHPAAGAIGSALMLLLFFFGEIFSPLRENSWLRFSLPPLALAVFLLLLSI